MECLFHICLLLFVFVNAAQNARIEPYASPLRFVREVYEDVDEGEGDQNLETTTGKLESRFGRHWPGPFRHQRPLDLPGPFDRHRHDYHQHHEPHYPKRFDFPFPGNQQPEPLFDHSRETLLPPHDPFLMPGNDFHFKPWHGHDHHKFGPDGHHQGCDHDHDHGRFPWEDRNIEKKPWKDHKRKKPEAIPIEETTTPEMTTTDVPKIDLRYNVGT